MEAVRRHSRLDALLDFPMYNIRAGTQSGRSADILHPLHAGVCVCVCMTNHPRQLHQPPAPTATIDPGRCVIMMDGHVSLWGTGGRLWPIDSTPISPPPPAFSSSLNAPLQS